MHAELRRLGQAVNRKRVERVMRERQIAGVARRRRGFVRAPAGLGPVLISPRRRVSGLYSRKRSALGSGSTGRPPAPRCSCSSRQGHLRYTSAPTHSSCRSSTDLSE
ncbi:IS3 family transposase [Streptomyces sp. NBC_01314]|uniref:IS3 family transposase n=1 Tax=Streptomyces sp. NBC_01314 TaxID=2903821 RepID=UPI00352C54D0